MCHLTAAETKCYFYFVALCNELAGCTYFGIKIIGVNVWRKANFLDFNCFLFFLCFFFLAGQFISVLSVVDNFANRRFRCRSNFHKIQTCFLCFQVRISGRHNSKLFSVLTDQTNFSVSDLLVNH